MADSIPDSIRTKKNDSQVPTRKSKYQLQYITLYWNREKFSFPSCSSCSFCSMSWGHRCESCVCLRQWKKNKDKSHAVAGKPRYATRSIRQQHDKQGRTDAETNERTLS